MAVLACATDVDASHRNCNAILEAKFRLVQTLGDRVRGRYSKWILSKEVGTGWAEARNKTALAERPTQISYPTIVPVGRSRDREALVNASRFSCISDTIFLFSSRRLNRSPLPAGYLIIILINRECPMRGSGIARERCIFDQPRSIATALFHQHWISRPPLALSPQTQKTHHSERKEAVRRRRGEVQIK